MKYELPSVVSVVNYEGNRIIRECASFKRDIALKLISEEPFVVEFSKMKFLLTDSKEDINIGLYKNVLLTEAKPIKKDLLIGEIKFLYWIKHEYMEIKSPEHVYATWKNGFNFIKEDTVNKVDGLRPPQVAALYAILSHFTLPKDRGLVVMPTGTGKTETMLSTLIANESKKVLVIVPSDSLRKQISDKFITLGVLKDFGLVDEFLLTPNVGVVSTWFDKESVFKEFIKNSNVVVTTMDMLASRTFQEIKFLNDSFSHLFVDEAHHSEAKSWSRIIESFDKRKVLLFTATPFRNDGKKIRGQPIYKFSLKDAQDQGYYKRINFQPIREYDLEESDRRISEIAVKQLRNDIHVKKYEHILMARCNSVKRAKEVFKYYKPHVDLSPILVYSSIKNKESIIENIKKRKHKIIVCVNMLGEGFDLPELKIAAVHDERQSIPITLQFIGRFTRTSHKNIGDATFITNIAYPPLQKELDLMYDMDADWNMLLSYIGDEIVDERVNFKQFIEGFKKIKESNIPVESIMPAFSSLVYEFRGDTWSPKKWRLGLSRLSDYDNVLSDYNSEENILVVLLGKLSKNEWGGTEEFISLKWDIILVYWDSKNELVYLNTSLGSINDEKFLEGIFGDGIVKYQGQEVFKVFHDISMLRLNNFGARKINGKDISYQSFFGSGVGDGLSELDQKNFIKNNTFGIGYRNGNRISIGATVKGKIWSHLRGDIKEWTNWCKEIGSLLSNENIDSGNVFKHTVIPQRISEIPSDIIITADWNPIFYEVLDSNLLFTCNGVRYDLSEADLLVKEQDLKNVLFDLRLGNNSIIFKFYLIDENKFGIAIVTSNMDVRVTVGNFTMKAVEFFKEYPPLFMFSENSNLLGNYYSKVTEQALELSLDNVIGFDWGGVSIKKESQGVEPYVKDSIQYHFIKELKESYDLIFDDDGAGEIADVIGVKNENDIFTIDLFHLKYSSSENVGNRVTDFYEVCGQAQKSLRWKYKEGRDFYNRLLKRESKKKKYKGVKSSRIIKGDISLLEKYLNQAKRGKKIIFNINIVQPSVSKVNISPEILTLLGNTSHYLKSMGNVLMKLYCSK